MNTTLHVIEQLADYGGTPRVLLNLASHNASSRGRLIVATYMPSALQKEFQRYGAEVCNLNTQALGPLAWKIAKMAHLVGADAICTHHTRPLVAGYLASKMTGIPLIHNEHSSANYRSGIARALANICLPAADAIVCNSRYTADSIHAVYKPPLERIRVLYNPVDYRECLSSRAAMRSEMNIGEHEVVVGHVGGMIPSRDQVTLIRAFQKMKITVPDARLVMIGDGPLRGDLESIVRESGVASSVQFIGYTERIGDYLSAMDIYVNSTVDEGFGIAVIEAMIAGLPVVLANAGAHPELITDGKTGLLYPGGDVMALTERLVKLANDTVLRRELASAAAPIARSRFSSKEYVHGYQKLITEIIDSRNTKRWFSFKIK
jgi:glycosyltransferase involved in cell wall biosynthesis